MDKINSVEDFIKLSKDEKKRIYNANIESIEKYIYNSGWYKAQTKSVRKLINKHKPWHLYVNASNGTPVRLYGVAGDDAKNVSYLVATMEDNECNSLSTGMIQDINLIKPISWSDIDIKYILNLIKAKSYGGDVIFLKPEMFLVLTKQC